MPQFETPNIDEAISQRMGDLSGLIASTPAQAGSPNALPEGVNLTGVGDPTMPAGAAQYLGNVTDPGVGGVTSDYGPGAGVDPAEVQRLHQIAYDASLARINAEEQAFQASIQHLSEYDQRQLMLERELEQTREVNSWLNDQVEGQRRSQTTAQLQQNKNQWVIFTAAGAGLPMEEESVRQALHAAKSPQEMQRIAQNLAGLMRGGGQAAVNGYRGNGMLAPGGRPGPSSPQGPKPRSGDIAGLIASRGPITVNMG